MNVASSYPHPLILAAGRRVRFIRILFQDNFSEPRAVCVLGYSNTPEIVILKILGRHLTIRLLCLVPLLLANIREAVVRDWIYSLYDWLANIVVSLGYSSVCMIYCVISDYKR